MIMFNLSWNILTILNTEIFHQQLFASIFICTIANGYKYVTSRRSMKRITKFTPFIDTSRQIENDITHHFTPQMWHDRTSMTMSPVCAVIHNVARQSACLEQLAPTLTIKPGILSVASVGRMHVCTLYCPVGSICRRSPECIPQS